MLRDRRDDTIDDLLERRALLAIVRRPHALILRRAIHASAHDAEQVLASALDREIVALEIEEEITGRWRG